MKIIDTIATREALPFKKLILALKNMFIEGCQVPLRHTYTLGNAGNMALGTILIMPAWQPGGYLGIKTVTIFPQNYLSALPGLHSTYILYDAQTGVPLAQMDGNEITSRRTAAASALAASFLAPVNARHMLVLGAGRVGNLLPEAYRPCDQSSALRCGTARRNTQTLWSSACAVPSSTSLFHAGA